MNRHFLALAVADGTLLIVNFALGLAGAGRARGPGNPYYDIHFLLGLLTMLTTLLVHSIVFTYFLGTGRWVKEVVRVYGLPDWVWSQAVRNKRRAFPFEMGCMVLIGATVWLGAAADTRAGFGATWHLLAAATTIGFSLGAFAVEYAAIVAQGRLLLEVKDLSDRLRAAQVGAVAGDAGPTPGAGDLDPL